MTGPTRSDRDRAPVPRAVWLLLPLLTLAWGVNWPILKTGVSEVPVWTFRTLTTLSGAAGMFLIATGSGLRLAVPWRELPGLALAAFCNITLFNILVLYGVDSMESGRAAVLAYSMPLWAVLIALPVMRTRLSVLQWLGLALGLAGMSVLIAGDVAAIGAAPWATMMIVGAAIAWGAGTVIVKAGAFTTPTTVFVAWQLLIGSLPIVVMMLAVDFGRWEAVSLWPALSVLYNMLVTAIFCYWAWFRIVALVPVAVSTVSTLMIPVVGVASGALLLGERPGLDVYIALALVAVSILAVFHRRSG